MAQDLTRASAEIKTQRTDRVLITNSIYISCSLCVSQLANMLHIVMTRVDLLVRLELERRPGSALVLRDSVRSCTPIASFILDRHADFLLHSTSDHVKKQSQTNSIRDQTLDADVLSMHERCIQLDDNYI